MKIDLLFFASCRQIVGRRQDNIELEEGTTVRRFKGVLANMYPSLKGQLNFLAIAVNAEYVSEDCRLVAGDEVALMPPVSGGV